MRKAVFINGILTCIGPVLICFVIWLLRVFFAISSLLSSENVVRDIYGVLMMTIIAAVPIAFLVFHFKTYSTDLKYRKKLYICGNLVFGFIFFLIGILLCCDYVNSFGLTSNQLVDNDDDGFRDMMITAMIVNAFQGGTHLILTMIMRNEKYWKAIESV